MKALTIAELDRALARDRNKRKKVTKKAAKKVTHRKKATKKAAKKVVHRKKTAKKAHKRTGPLRGAAKAEFLARMKRGRARARRG